MSFLESLKQSNIITIGGISGVGKSTTGYYLSSYIRSNKPLLLIGSDLSKYSENYFQNYNIENLVNITDSIVFIDGLDNLTDNFNFKGLYSIYKAKYDRLSQIAVMNNLTIIITVNIYKNVGNNTTTFFGGDFSVLYMSDTVISCYKEDNNIKYKILKSRLFDGDVINLNSIIKVFIRKQRIDKLLAEI